MRRIQIKLDRRNDKGKMTTRYRWEILWSDELKLVMLAERYGWTGDSAFFWVHETTSSLFGKLRERFEKFNQPNDRLSLTNVDTFTSDQIVEEFRQWSSGKSDDVSRQKMVQTATYRFLNSKKPSASMSDSMQVQEVVFAELTSLIGAYSIEGGAELFTTEKPVVKIEEETFVQHQNWGAW